MVQLLNQNSLIGQQIQKVGYTGNRLVLFFTDNTYAVFRGCGWEETDVELMADPYSIELTEHNEVDLLQLGVISKDTYYEIVKKKEDKKKRQQEDFEKEQYEMLRKKYETNHAG